MGKTKIYSNPTLKRKYEIEEYIKDICSDEYLETMKLVTND
jgi:hypothetical protein